MADGLEITRVFEAPRERVWREWTEPERFADWFGGPEAEIPPATVSMDVREGGSWRATMYYGPDRTQVNWHGEYQEVVPPERLVLTMCDKPEAERVELVIVDLVDLGDGRTELRLRQRGDMTPDQYKAARSGWSGFLDRIAERLAGWHPQIG